MKHIQTVRIQTIPVLPEPVLIKSEEAPKLKLPPVIVINSNEASFYFEACEDFKQAGQEDAYSLEELKEMYKGLTQDDACNFNIYGFTLQGWLSFESEMTKIAGYVENLRNHISYLENVIKERQKIIQQRNKILKQTKEETKTESYN